MPESPDRTAALVEWIQGLFDDADVPVLVAGAAVELYTRGAYTTGDLDFVGTVTPLVAERLGDNGFVRKGRHWVHEEGRVFVEFPGVELGEGEEAVDLQVGECSVRALAPEALIVDRLAAWQFWRSEEDAVNALLVARSTDWDRGQAHALAERTEATAAFESLLAAIGRWEGRNPSPEELEGWVRTIPGA